MAGNEEDRRKAVDAKFSDLEQQLALLRFEMVNNTEITKQVRDVLSSFKVIGHVAKWLTVMGAFGAMCWHGVVEWRK